MHVYIEGCLLGHFAFFKQRNFYEKWTETFSLNFFFLCDTIFL